MSLALGILRWAVVVAICVVAQAICRSYPEATFNVAWGGGVATGFLVFALRR